MDPVFNDTTTYDIAPESPSISQLADVVQADRVVQDVLFELPQTLAQSEEYSGQQNGADVKNRGTSNIALNGTSENQAISINDYAHSSNADALDLQRTLDSLAHFTENAHANAQPEQSLSGGDVAIEDDAMPVPEVSANDSHAQSDSAVRIDSPDHVVKEGVNYQSLLDTLSQSTATAPIADTLPAPTTSSTSDETRFLQTGSEKPLPVGAGLPPRPLLRRSRQSIQIIRPMKVFDPITTCLHKMSPQLPISHSQPVIDQVALLVLQVISLLRKPTLALQMVFPHPQLPLFNNLLQTLRQSKALPYKV